MFVGVVLPKRENSRGGIKEVHRNDFNLEMLFAESVVLRSFGLEGQDRSLRMMHICQRHTDIH